ncbi:MAG: efflux RND transporter periplasmic adaptor subunit [Candidatus Sumerlaeia bacterium]
MWKKVLITIGICLTIVALSLLFISILVITKSKPSEREAENKGLPVQVITAEKQDMQVLLEATGTAQPRTLTQLVAQVAGDMVFIAPELRSGGIIRKGMVLTKQDPENYELAVQRIQTQLGKAEIDLEELNLQRENMKADLDLSRQREALAKRSFERAKTLLQTQTGSEAARDKAESDWLNSQAQVLNLQNNLKLLDVREKALKQNIESIEVQLKEAKINLENTTIRSPFDGRALMRMVELGEYANPGKTLGRIYDSSTMEVPCRLPVSDIVWLGIDAENLQNGRVPESEAPTARLRLKTAGQIFEWTGRVTRIDSEIDATTRMSGVTIEVRDFAGKLINGGPRNNAMAPPFIPGLFLDIIIEGRKLQNVSAIPRGLVTPKSTVYIAREDKLHIQDVEVLRYMGDLALIGADIEAGDKIVASPIGMPVDGMLLQVREGEPPLVESSEETSRAEDPETTGAIQP